MIENMETDKQKQNSSLSDERKQKKELFMSQLATSTMTLQTDRFRKKDPTLYKKRYPTGFKFLDEIMDGGLTAGLHVLGAISSLGKSTFCWQIAQNVAKSGTPVIYYSLEMHSEDLTAKAISRTLYLENKHSPGSYDLIKNKTSNFLTSEKQMSSISSEEHTLIDQAIDKVNEAAKNIYIIECGRSPVRVKDIIEFMQMYCESFPEKKPFVIVDYLQIIDAPLQLLRASDKQICDYNMKHLGVLANHLRIPILLISSFNRDGYDVKVSKKSFKDSGNIEYSSDTLMGMQYHGIEEDGFDVIEASKAIPRSVELVILKQRYGQVGVALPYLFYTTWSHFEEKRPDDDALKFRKIPKKVLNALPETFKKDSSDKDSFSGRKRF